MKKVTKKQFYADYCPKCVYHDICTTEMRQDCEFNTDPEDLDYLANWFYGEITEIIDLC